MPINNPLLYDAAYCAIANSNSAWTNDAVPSDYAGMRDAATNIATEVDALIAPISPAPTLSEVLLMESIVKSTFASRYALDMPASFYAVIADTIVAQWIEFGSGLQSAYSMQHTPSAFVYFFDTDSDGEIPNYFVLTNTPKYVSDTQAVATATGTPNATVQFIFSGNPIAWIAAEPLGVPYVQQGEWVSDLYASVSQANSTTNVILKFYARTTGNVENHLFDITSSRISSLTPAKAATQITEGMFSANPTDRLVVKAFAQFSGTAVPTTASLYFQGPTNATHVHTPVEASSPPPT